MRVEYWVVALSLGVPVYVRGPHIVEVGDDSIDRVLEEVFDHDQVNEKALTGWPDPKRAMGVVARVGRAVVVAICLPRGWICEVRDEGGRRRRVVKGSMPPGTSVEDWMSALDSVARVADSLLEPEPEAA